MNVWDALWLPSLAGCGLLLCCGVVGLLLRLFSVVVVFVPVFCGGGKRALHSGFFPVVCLHFSLLPQILSFPQFLVTSISTFLFLSFSLHEFLFSSHHLFFSSRLPRSEHQLQFGIHISSRNLSPASPPPPPPRSCFQIS